MCADNENHKFIFILFNYIEGEKMIDRRFIPLGRMQFAIVDSEDFDDIMQNSWYAHKDNKDLWK